jgi:hypothetical protein
VKQDSEGDRKAASTVFEPRTKAARWEWTDCWNRSARVSAMNVEGECHARCGQTTTVRTHVAMPEPPDRRSPLPRSPPSTFSLCFEQSSLSLTSIALHHPPSHACLSNIPFSDASPHGPRIASLAVLCLKFLMLTTHFFPWFFSLRCATVYQCAQYRCHDIFLSPLKIMPLYLFQALWPTFSDSDLSRTQLVGFCVPV